MKQIFDDPLMEVIKFTVKDDIVTGSTDSSGKIDIEVDPLTNPTNTDIYTNLD